MRSFLLTLALVGLVGDAPAQSAGAARLPFAIGERLEYRVHVTAGGNVGTNVMRVDGPEMIGGVAHWVLRSEIDAGRGPIRAVDRSTSWLDPRSFRIARFEKVERHPLSRSVEAVRIDFATHTFVDSGSAPQPLGSSAPLDELSFVYFIRTLPLAHDTTLRFDRHFDPARNPTVVRISAGEVVTTPAGQFRTRLVEMEVRDPKRFRGTGTIRLYLETSPCRVPVRIESRLPLLGATTLELTGWSHPPGYPSAFGCEG